MARRRYDDDDYRDDDDDDRPARRRNRSQPQGTSAGLVVLVIGLSLLVVAGVPLGTWLLLRNAAENKNEEAKIAAPAPQPPAQPGLFLPPGQQPQPPVKPAVRPASGPQIGQTAPEIEGEDIDGQRFKLSDYRGKVVVLDFWGHW